MNETHAHIASDVPLVGWDSFAEDGDDDGVAGEIGDTLDMRGFDDAGFPLGIFGDLFADLINNFDGFFDVAIVMDTDIKKDAAVVHGAIDDASDGTIWDKMDAAVEVADGSGTSADTFNLADRTVDIDDIAYAELVFGDDENTAEEIFD